MLLPVDVFSNCYIHLLFSHDLRFGSLHSISPCLVDLDNQVGFGFDDLAESELDGSSILHLTVADDQLEDTPFFRGDAEPRNGFREF